MPRGTKVRLGAGDIVLDGDPAPPIKEGHSIPTFRPTMLWHGRPSQQLLSSYTFTCTFVFLYLLRSVIAIRYFVPTNCKQLAHER